MFGAPNPFSSGATRIGTLPSLHRSPPYSSSASASVFGATYAPLSSSLPAQHSAAYWARYLRRGFAISQWDLEYAFYQIINCCRAPQQVYKLTLHRKQTKNQWARDDPSFVGLLLGFLAVVAVGYGVAYRYTSPLAYLWLITQHWLTFFGWGLAVSTTLWAITNRYCRISGTLPHSVEQSVEWLFAWDIHCNAFVPVLLLVYVADFLVLPLTMRSDGLLPCLVGNTLYTAAIGQYLYITFQGFVGASQSPNDSNRVIRQRLRLHFF